MTKDILYLPWQKAQMLLLHSLSCGVNTMLIGAPGVGKTAMVRQTAPILHFDKVLFMHPVTNDPTDFRGILWVVDGQAKWMFTEEIRTILTSGEPLLVCIDDAGQAPAAVQAALMQLVYGGWINGQRIPDSVKFVLCTNREEDNAGVASFLEPLKGRLFPIGVSYDNESLMNYAIDNDWNEYVIAWLTFRGSQVLSNWKTQEGFASYPQPRTIENLSRLMNNTATTNPLLLAIVTNILGEAEGMYFMQMIDLAGLPDISALLNNPDGPLPTETGKLYGIAIALSTYIKPDSDQQNLQNIQHVLDRMSSSDFSMLAWNIALRRDPTLKYNAFCVQNILPRMARIWGASR